LVLKAVSSDMKSYGGFQWPGVGGVAVADDWDASPTCGGGLHGWLNGVGDASCQSWSKSPDAKWLVLSVDTETLVDLWGKVKFPEAEVVHVGDKKSAGDVILATGFIGPVIGATVTGGDVATVTGGNYAMVTGGYGATVTGGANATVTGGGHATVTGGHRATVTGGHGAILLLSFYSARKRVVTAYVGENGIKPNTPYRLNEVHEFEEVKNAEKRPG
jgi:hypothetical protein